MHTDGMTSGKKALGVSGTRGRLIALALVAPVAAAAVAVLNPQILSASGPVDRLGNLADAPAGGSEPDRGTIDPPAEVRNRIEGYRGPKGDDDGTFDRADVLAVTAVNGISLTTVGVARSSGIDCWSTYSEAASEVTTDLTCTSRGFRQPNLSASRSRVDGAARDFVSGWAPAGTETIVLSDGKTTSRVSTSASGGRWQGRVFYLAPWDSRGTVAVTALGSNGATLAMTTSDGV